MAHTFRPTVVSICAFALLTLATTRNAHATIDASVTISSTGTGPFNYTLTLNNLPTSTSPIETLWFSWVPGLDFMSAGPTSTTAPAGWGTYVESGSYYGGYSIQFTTTSAPLAPGNSLQFAFTSPVTPTELAGNDQIFGYYPELTTYLYSVSVESGVSEQVVAEQVPEPSTLALVGFGTAVAAFGIAWRKLRFRTQK